MLQEKSLLLHNLRIRKAKGSLRIREREYIMSIKDILNNIRTKKIQIMKFNILCDGDLNSHNFKKLHKFSIILLTNLDSDLASMFLNQNYLSNHKIPPINTYLSYSTTIIIRKINFLECAFLMFSCEHPTQLPTIFCCKFFISTIV